MTAFIARRLLHMVPLLLAISIISFIVINLPPGDYLTVKILELESRGDTGARRIIEQWRVRYGLDKPLYMQYWIWVSNFVKGDFGLSFEYDRPVSQLIGQRLLLTVLLSLSTLLFTWLIAIPIGIYSATHQYSAGDQIFSFLGYIGMSLPNFLLALILMYLSVVHFGWSVGGLFSPEFQDASWSFAKFVDFLKHLWIPVIVLGTAGTAGLIRVMRSAMLETLGQQFVQTARAKGLAESVVVYKHTVRVAINPLITMLGYTFPAILSGDAITAVILNLPTTGPLLLRALEVQDMYLAGTILLFLSLFLVIGNLVADILLSIVDPRIRYD
ncbi:MAG: ABC transporter permease [Clostridia bacterium]|nr:ABC transporter permease [Bacillota bacterium]MBO2521826.1 ABC transporter permease [Bacillota bacterium]